MENPPQSYVTWRNRAHCGKLLLLLLSVHLYSALSLQIPNALCLHSDAQP